MAWNALHIGPTSPFVNRRSPIVEPPPQKVSLVHPILQQWMVNDCRRFVTQPLARGHQSPAKFSVLIWSWDFRVGAGPQISAKAPGLFKHLLSVRHVGAVRSYAEFGWLQTMVEQCGEDSTVVRILEAEPRGGKKGCARRCSSFSALFSPVEPLGFMASRNKRSLS